MKHQILFETYEKKHNQLKKTYGKSLPRTLRLFNIRLRLALDISVGFKGEKSLTKTKDVRETYMYIIQLMEAWNAYEALFQYAEEQSQVKKGSHTKSRVYPDDLLRKSKTLDYLNNELNWFTHEFKTNPNFQKDFKQYITRKLKGTSNIVMNDANDMLNYLNNGSKITGIAIISLIYAERNLYYHNGEAAKMGMSYQNRKKLIKKYREVLLDHILYLAIYIIEEHIRTITKNNK